MIIYYHTLWIALIIGMFASSCKIAGNESTKNSFDSRRDLLAEGAARLKFHEVFNAVYEQNSNTKLSFGDFRLKKTKMQIDELPFWQYTWSYEGSENLGEWRIFSVFLAPSEEGIWIEQGEPEW